MADSKQILQAASNQDLRRRFIAMAAGRVPNPEHFVEQHMYALVKADLDGDGPNNDSVAAVLDYAIQTQPPAPGLNPAAVTDTHIADAITQILESPELNPTV